MIIEQRFMLEGLELHDLLNDEKFVNVAGAAFCLQTENKELFYSDVFNEIKGQRKVKEFTELRLKQILNELLFPREVETMGVVGVLLAALYEVKETEIENTLYEKIESGEIKLHEMLDELILQLNNLVDQTLESEIDFPDSKITDVMYKMFKAWTAQNIKELVRASTIHDKEQIFEIQCKIFLNATNTWTYERKVEYVEFLINTELRMYRSQYSDVWGF